MGNVSARRPVHDTQISGGIPAGSKGKFLKKVNNKIVLCDSATDEGRWVMHDNNEYLDNAVFAPYKGGIVPILAGTGGITEGNKIGTDAEGKAIIKSTAGDFISGYCEYSAGADEYGLIDLDQQFILP